MSRTIAYGQFTNHAKNGQRAVFEEASGPRTVDIGAADLFANYTDVCVMKAKNGETPFDNGTTDYAYIEYGHTAAGNLRVSYSADSISGWVADAAVSGSVATAQNPQFAIDQNQIRNSGAKTANKYLFYIDGAVAANAAGRLKYAMVDNDNNGTVTGEASIDLTNILGAASAWNENLQAICYAKVDTFFTVVADGAPQDNAFLLLGVFDDGTNSFLGAIYGKTLATLKAAKININTTNGVASLSANGPGWIAPMVGDYGRLASLKHLGLAAIVSNQSTTLATPDSASLVLAQVGVKSWAEYGNSFLGLNMPNANTKLSVRTWLYRSDQTAQKNTLFIYGDDTSDSVRFGLFRGLGHEANDTGEATYV